MKFIKIMPEATDFLNFYSLQINSVHNRGGIVRGLFTDFFFDYYRPVTTLALAPNFTVKHRML